MSHRLYLGNKMTEIPYFNAPWFDMAEKSLLAVPTVIEVFSPAEHDRMMGFNPMLCPAGSKEESRAAGFDVRKALLADWSWIANNSTGMIAGPDWTRSPGAKSEVACHHALGLPVWEYDAFLRYWNDPPALRAMVVPPMLAVSLVMADDPDEDEDGGLVCDCHG